VGSPDRSVGDVPPPVADRTGRGHESAAVVGPGRALVPDLVVRAADVTVGVGARLADVAGPACDVVVVDRDGRGVAHRIGLYPAVVTVGGVRQPDDVAGDGDVVGGGPHDDACAGAEQRVAAHRDIGRGLGRILRRTELDVGPVGRIPHEVALDDTAAGVLRRLHIEVVVDAARVVGPVVVDAVLADVPRLGCRGGTEAARLEAHEHVRVAVAAGDLVVVENPAGAPEHADDVVVVAGDGGVPAEADAGDGPVVGVLEVDVPVELDRLARIVLQHEASSARGATVVGASVARGADGLVVGAAADDDDVARTRGFRCKARRFASRLVPETPAEERGNQTGLMAPGLSKLRTACALSRDKADD